jgi:hypothetical protein
MEELKTLIENAQEVIKQNRFATIYKPAVVVELFLSSQGIPVNYYYEEKDFYTYNVYPINNFIDIINSFNNNIRETVSDTAICKPFIYNFIHNSYLEKFELVKFFNIFYPYSNHKFTFDTFEAEARLDKTIKLKYVHPKYVFEEVLHKFCLVDQYDNWDKLVELKDRIIADWQRIDGKELFVETKPLSNSFSPTQINILSMISTLEAPIIRCFYDQRLPIIITNSLGLELIEFAIKSTTTNYERKNNSSKSFFDNRIANVIFRIGDEQIVKIFPLLDYEVVPTTIQTKSAEMRKQETRMRMMAVSDNRSQSPSAQEDRIIDCHPNIALRLAFNEYITYNIVDAHDVAKSKLKLFASLLSHYGIQKIDWEVQTVLGIYYPFDIYIKEMRVRSILKAREKK